MSFICKNRRITNQCSFQCIAIVGRVLESAFDKGTIKSWRECKNRDIAPYSKGWVWFSFVYNENLED